MSCPCGCGAPVPAGTGARVRRFASGACRVRVHRARRRGAPVRLPPAAVIEDQGNAADWALGGGETLLELGQAQRFSGPAVFGWADPPYPGCGTMYPERVGVNHPILIGTLCHHFPRGWALSTGSRQLQRVLRFCPDGVRIGVWTRDTTVRRVRGRSRAWEALIVCGGRDLSRVTDDVHREEASKARFTGDKPPGFNGWVLSMLGALAGDQLADLFPGTGSMRSAAAERNVSACWA